MNNKEFKVKKFKETTVYTLESATAGGTSAGSVASVSKFIGGVQRRTGDNFFTQEDTTPIKPRRGPLKPHTGGGSHKDRTKTIPRKDKHRKKPMDMSEGRHEFDKKTGQMGYTTTDADQRHGLYIDGKLVKTYNSREACDNVKKRDPKFKDATIKKIAEDHEIQMASSELLSISKNAKNLLNLVQQYSERDGLEAWQQSKITRAADYLNSVLQAVNGEQYATEGHTIMPGFDKERYQPRQGLEGPFHTRSGKVVYYDPREGKYYDPDSDFHISHDDWQAMNEQDVEEGSDAYMNRLSATLSEKLDPNAPVDVWIDDFQKADPEKYHQFRQNNRPGTNKTPEYKERMAKAASYAAKTNKRS
jgi:hypothetical protein